MSLVLLQLAQTDARKPAPFYVTVEGLLLHMRLHVLLQLARRAGGKPAVRKAAVERLLSRVRADVHLQVTVARGAVVAVRVGTFQRLLPRVRAQVRRQYRFGDGRVGAAGEGTLVRLLPRVRADVHLQIAVASRRVGTILVGTREATNLRFLKSTTHGRGLHRIELRIGQHHLVATAMLVFDSRARYVVDIEEEVRNNDQLALRCGVESGELAHEVLVRAMLCAGTRRRHSGWGVVHGNNVRRINTNSSPIVREETTLSTCTADAHRWDSEEEPKLHRSEMERQGEHNPQISKKNGIEEILEVRVDVEPRVRNTV